MGTLKTGWCLTGHHGSCPHENFGRICPCECHEKTTCNHDNFSESAFECSQHEGEDCHELHCDNCDEVTLHEEKEEK